MAARPLTRASKTRKRRSSVRRLWRRGVRGVQKLDRPTKILLVTGVAGSAILAWIVAMATQ